MKEETMNYSIGELAKILGTNEHTLRYYEKEKLVNIARISNIRRYSENDRKQLEFLLQLKNSGMSIKELKEFTNSELPLEERIKQLKKQKEKIDHHCKKLRKCQEAITEELDKNTLLFNQLEEELEKNYENNH
ncbi:hypothetical protein RV10_GL003822 [Enterococcus pallens]|nr:hypothetical protein RV10_GL003822 [Enterococcus pallens]